MIETQRSARVRRAYLAAHQLRGAAFSQIVRRIFNRDVD